MQSAVELADVLSKSDAFTNCMAASVLKYALLDAPGGASAPLMYSRRAALLPASRMTLRHSNGQSFTDLTNAVATSPAFVLRQQVQ